MGEIRLDLLKKLYGESKKSDCCKERTVIVHSGDKSYLMCKKCRSPCYESDDSD